MQDRLPEPRLSRLLGRVANEVFYPWAFVQPGAADGVGLGVDQRGELLEQRPVARFGLGQLGQLPAGSGKPHGVVDGRSGYLPEAAQQFNLGLAEASAQPPRGHAEHPNHRAVRVQRYGECAADLVLSASSPQPPRPALVVPHGQRRTDPPDLARQPLPLADAAAHAGRKASSPVPDDKPLATVRIVLDEIDQHVRGAHEPPTRGDNLFEQVSDLWRLAGLGQGLSRSTHRSEPGVGPCGRHVASRSISARHPIRSTAGLRAVRRWSIQTGTHYCRGGLEATYKWRTIRSSQTISLPAT